MNRPLHDLPPGVRAGTFDQLEAMLQAEQPDTVWMELGAHGHFGAADVIQASQALHQAINKVTAKQCLILSIGGYDDDPRELWNIPEALKFIRRVMVEAGIRHWQHPAVVMFNEGTMALLLQCGVFGTDHPFTVNVHVDKEISFDRYKQERNRE